MNFYSARLEYNTCTLEHTERDINTHKYVPDTDTDIYVQTFTRRKTDTHIQTHSHRHTDRHSQTDTDTHAHNTHLHAHT